MNLLRRWCLKFPGKFTKSLRKRQGKLGDIWYLDEVFITVNGNRQYLWRAVDQDGEVVDVFLQSRRDGATAKRFFQASTAQAAKRTKKDRYGQAEKLRCCASTPHTGDDSRYKPVCQQQGRAFSSANASTGARYALLQICPASATFLKYARDCMQFV